MRVDAYNALPYIGHKEDSKQMEEFEDDELFAPMAICSVCGNVHPAYQMERRPTGNWECGCTMTDEELNAASESLEECQVQILRQNWGIKQPG